MGRQAADALWPAATPPHARVGMRWELRQVSELSQVRAELRRYLATHSPDDAELRDRLVLAMDEMASNALRHGRGRVTAVVGRSDHAYLVVVSDEATGSPPVPAVGRDAGQGGLGLYLVAELAHRHGWYADGGRKHVWALLPRS